MAALIIAQQTQPCHCGDVTVLTERVNTMESTPNVMSVSTPGYGACASGPPGFRGNFSRDASCRAAFNAWNSVEDAQRVTGGQASSSSTGTGMPLAFATGAGGNGVCHCKHVEDHERRLRALESQWHDGAPRSSEARAPFLPRREDEGARTTSLPGRCNLVPTDLAMPLELGLPFGPLANVEKLDKGIYDDKLTTNTDYMSDGVKDGAFWKSKLERYFISKLPAMMEILKWADARNVKPITGEDFFNVSQHKLSITQCQTISAAVWRFLSGCLSGQAELMFKRSPMLNGLGAWRRIVRMIDSSLPLKLEQLRDQVRMIHTKPIEALESIATGAAEFETKLEEYGAAGGTGYESDSIRKSDLLAVLPHKLREDLLWNSTGSETCEGFRDTVLAQGARIFSLRKKGGVHLVDGIDEKQGAEGEHHEVEEAPISTMEGLIAAVHMMKADGCRRPPKNHRQAG